MHSLPPKLFVLAPKQLLSSYLTDTLIYYSETYLCPDHHWKQHCMACLEAQLQGLFHFE